MPTTPRPEPDAENRNLAAPFEDGIILRTDGRNGKRRHNLGDKNSQDTEETQEEERAN